MDVVIPHKQTLLHTVSGKALAVGVVMSRNGVCPFGARYGDGARHGGAWGFLLWLRIFFGWLVGEECASYTVPILEPRIINRRDRRRERRKLGRNSPPVSEIAMLFHLFGRGTNRWQFKEKLCQMSLHGRVRIYGLGSVGNVLVRRAKLVCYDHGWWREPIGTMGRLRCGVWRVHLWPEWWLSGRHNRG